MQEKVQVVVRAGCCEVLLEIRPKEGQLDIFAIFF